ncbi:MAG: gliding motility-associated C-terminal domain-containing protein [Bacteroidales bacterium]|nr:gliding motility-associated C-terminal domain-containing protein [Bacteroidales bacterium]
MKSIAFLIMIVGWCLLDAQLFYNNGAVVHLKSGAIVQVNGSLTNASGGIVTLEAVPSSDLYIAGDLTNNATINGAGNIHLWGNWTNNATFNHNNGHVMLKGGNQTLGGTQITTFFNLTLLGTGIKTQAQHEQVAGVLNLNDRELATQTYTMYVLNTSTNAIQRTTGFVSSLNGGYLSRQTNQNASYLFPVGSSVGTPRYRPVELTPATAAANTYVVRMANVDATSEGYDRSQMEAGLCQINPYFYHQINRTAGVDAVNMRIYYNPVQDGNWDNLARWYLAPNQWRKLVSSATTAGTPMYYGWVNAWNDFSQQAFALSRGAPIVNLGNDTTICSTTPLTLNAGTGFDSYSWSTGSNSQSIQVSTSGTYSVTVTAGSCNASDAIQVTVINTPVVELGPNQNICQGNTVVLDAGNPGALYDWSTNEHTQTITVGTSGTYSVTVTNGGLCSATDQVTITVYPYPVVDLGNDTAFCQGNTLVLNAGNPGATYNWSTGSSNSTINVSTSGTYSVTVTYGGICSTSDAIQVTVWPAPVVNLGPDITICQGQQAVLDAGNPGETYVWSTNENTQTIIVSTSGTYSVTVTNSYNCSNSDAVIVTVQPYADATITTTDTTYCSNENPVQLTAVTAGGTWSGPGITNSQNGTWNPATAGSGSHMIIYTIAGQCGDKDTIYLVVLSAPAIQIYSQNQICMDSADGKAWVQVTGGNQPYVYVWNNNASNDTIVNLLPGIYSVTVTDANGCKDAASVNVVASDDYCGDIGVWVPDIFSPNGDGMNDVLYVLGGGIKQMKFFIYDRWGEKVFETTTLQQGWDGTFRGKPVDPGVFVYYLSVTFINDETVIKKGNITVVR